MSETNIGNRGSCIWRTSVFWDEGCDKLTFRIALMLDGKTIISEILTSDTKLLGAFIEHCNDLLIPNKISIEL